MYLFLCNQSSRVPDAERGAPPDAAGPFSAQTAAADASSGVFYHKNDQDNRLGSISF